VTETKRGRKSREEEVADYLREQGKSIDDLPDAIIDLPEDPLEMLEEFKTELYKQMKRGEIKSTALVQALKTIDGIAEKYLAANPPKVEVREQGVDEILVDAGLPRERRIEIGRTEIERLRERENALQVVVARLEGEA